MMAIFSKAISGLFAIEGGYSDNSTDYGGETNGGISKRQYPGLDIKSLTVEQQTEILKQDYWDKYRCGEINDQAIANQVFFLFVNMNPFSAAEIIQKTINVRGRGLISIKVDGIFGSASIDALNSLTTTWLSDRLRLEACRYYLIQSDIDPSQVVNFRGWIRRALA